jgi:hypothetical protein
MTTILDEDQDEYQPIVPILMSNNNSNLLTDWVNEQIDKIRVIQEQIKRINDLPADKLDCLCDYLEDIDYHISGLNNILSLVIGVPGQQQITNETTANHELSEVNRLNEMESENLLPNKWYLLNALWFHMIMITDPDSIYYSTKIGRNAWPSQVFN